MRKLRMLFYYFYVTILMQYSVSQFTNLQHSCPVKEMLEFLKMQSSEKMLYYQMMSLWELWMLNYLSSFPSQTVNAVNSEESSVWVQDVYHSHVLSFCWWVFSHNIICQTAFNFWCIIGKLGWFFFVCLFVFLQCLKTSVLRFGERVTEWKVVIVTAASYS